MALAVVEEESDPKRSIAAVPSTALQASEIREGRKSGLDAPTMVLTGHDGEVLTVRFSPDGRNVATAGFDKQIFLYNVYGEPVNYCVLKGHSSAVLEIHWSTDGNHIYSCSADHTCAIWDTETGQRVKKLAGHHEIVNSCAPNRRGQRLLASGSDDGTTKIWDVRVRRCVKTFPNQYQILSVTFDDDSQRVFAGSLDNMIHVFDMRKSEADDPIKKHKDSVTGLDVSADGSYLLSNSMDQTIMQWDIRPFCPNNEQRLATLHGSTHNFEKNLLRVRWGIGDSVCSAGSANRIVCVWDMKSSDRQMLYQLPGHAGSVNDVAFHPKEPIIASAGSDKKVFMGELS